MICDDIRREMLDRDWDRATLGTASRVISHLDDCPACRQALEQYDTLRQLLHVAQEVPRSVRRDWAGRDWARAFPEVPKPAPRRLAWAMVMAASLVAGIAGWGMYLHDRTAADRPRGWPISPPLCRKMQTGRDLRRWPRAVPSRGRCR